MYFRAVDRLFPIMQAIKADPMSDDLDALVSEIERYLAAVDVFREQGYEPRWSSKGAAPYAEPATTATPVPAGTD
jgi:hypothetical protein